MRPLICRFRCACLALAALVLVAPAAASVPREVHALDIDRIGPAALHPLTLIYGLSGSAMISATLRVPKP